MDFVRTEKFCSGSCKVVDNFTVTDIKSVNFLHIFIGKSKIPYVKILFNSLLMHRFWNDHNTSLNIETKCNLCRCFVILITDFREYRMCENTMTAFCERSSCFKNNFEFLCSFNSLFLMEERMTFYLIDHWLNLTVQTEVSYTLRVEIADTYRLCFSIFIDVL